MEKNEKISRKKLDLLKNESWKEFSVIQKKVVRKKSNFYSNRK